MARAGRNIPFRQWIQKILALAVISSEVCQ